MPKLDYFDPETLVAYANMDAPTETIAATACAALFPWTTPKKANATR
jgi:hypothetical protein